MTTASISILKTHLSHYLDAVKSGEVVIVTERGRPIARLAPLDHTTEPAGRVAQLIREGRMGAPSKPGSAVPAEGRGVKDPDGRGLAILLEDRSTSR